MRIAVFANTPAQVHFYKNIIKKLNDHGHQTRLLVRDYGETISVADELKIDYMVFSKPSTSKIGKIISLPYDVVKAYKILRKFKPDIVTGFGIYDAFTSFFLGAKCTVFVDSEPSVNKLSYSIQLKIYIPFVDVIITPKSFMNDLGKKQIRVNSYKEFAYLHPNYYIPNENIKTMLGLKDNEEYFLLRFNAFDAVHDFGISGFSNEDKIRLVKELEKYGKVFISSESEVPDEIKNSVMKIPKSRIHDIIYYAKLLVTDTQTMATEAAILGTPTIRCNHFVGPNDMSNFTELDKKYGLIFNYREVEKAISKAVELVQQSDLKNEWKSKREKLLNDKIDMTKFMVWFIENYPESFEIMKENPSFQEKFK